jgi:hypothetical protein
MGSRRIAVANVFAPSGIAGVNRVFQPSGWFCTSNSYGERQEKAGGAHRSAHPTLLLLAHPTLVLLLVDLQYLGILDRGLGTGLRILENHGASFAFDLGRVKSLAPDRFVDLIVSGASCNSRHKHQRYHSQQGHGIPSYE